MKSIFPQTLALLLCSILFLNSTSFGQEQSVTDRLRALLQEHTSPGTQKDHFVKEVEAIFTQTLWGTIAVGTGLGFTDTTETLIDEYLEERADGESLKINLRASGSMGTGIAIILITNRFSQDVRIQNIGSAAGSTSIFLGSATSLITASMESNNRLFIENTTAPQIIYELSNLSLASDIDFILQGLHFDAQALASTRGMILTQLVNDSKSNNQTETTSSETSLARRQKSRENLTRILNALKEAQDAQENPVLSQWQEEAVNHLFVHSELLDTSSWLLPPSKTIARSPIMMFEMIRKMEKFFRHYIETEKPSEDLQAVLTEQLRRIELAYQRTTFLLMP